MEILHKFDLKCSLLTRLMISTTPWERANLSYDIFALHTIWNQVQSAT